MNFILSSYSTLVGKLSYKRRQITGQNYMRGQVSQRKLVAIQIIYLSRV